MTDYIKTIRQKIGHDMLIMVGAGVFVYKNDKLLVQQRRDNGLWSACHGGAIEVGETVEETARRELFEETGLAAEALELFGVYSGEDMFYTYPNGDQVYNISIYYSCRDFSGELTPQKSEVAQLRWVDIDDIPDNNGLPGNRAVSDFIESIKKTKREI